MKDIFLKSWRPYAWIILAGFVLYFKTLFFGFSFLDDNVLILNNYTYLSKPANILYAFGQKVFSHGFLPYYRPMLIISFILDAQMGGIGPFAYHLTNIAIHLAASCLLFLFLTKLGYSRKLSLFFSVIFTVHPVLTQAVAWVPGRNDSLLTVFSLASFIALFNFLSRPEKRVYYFAHILFFALAIFTKESAAVLVLMYLVYLHLVAREKLFSFREAVLSLGWLAVAALWFYLRHIAIKGSIEVTSYDTARLLARYSPALIQFTGKMLLPFNLSVFPTIYDTSFVYGFITIALVALAVWRTVNRRNNFIILGFLWFLLFLAPSLVRANADISVDFLEHRVYLPMIGFIIILLETDAVKGLLSRRSIFLISCVLIIPVFSVITFLHSNNFMDRMSFWRNAAETAPNSSFAHVAYGLTCHAYGDLEKAENEYRRALKIDPQQSSAYYALGDVYLVRNEMDKAELEYKKSIASYPLSDNSYLNLGIIYYKLGRLKQAEDAWNKVLSLEPDSVGANKFLAILYYERKDLDKARYHARRLQELGMQPPADFMKSLGME